MRSTTASGVIGAICLLAAGAASSPAYARVAAEPTQGMLVIATGAEEPVAVFPLEHTDVSARIVAMLLPLFDPGDDLFTQLLLEAAYAGLLDGLIEFSAGVGSSLPSGGHPGLAYMGSVELRLPTGRSFNTGLQLRFDGMQVPDTDDDLKSFSLGLQLSW